MTVTELIEELRKYPGDTDVAMFNDDEYCHVEDVVEEVSDRTKKSLILLHLGYEIL
jgi:hypothetical protein